LGRPGFGLYNGSKPGPVHLREKKKDGSDYIIAGKTKRRRRRWH